MAQHSASLSLPSSLVPLLQDQAQRQWQRLVELAPGVTADEVAAKTTANYEVALG